MVGGLGLDETVIILIIPKILVMCSCDLCFHFSQA